MAPTVGDLMDIIEALAPAALAEDWDNVGLQVGSRGWPVEQVTVSLDPSPPVVFDACRRGPGLLVAHHPLTLKPVRRLDLDGAYGDVVRRCVEARLAVVSAHTNLDSAVGGINDLLAGFLGLERVEPLVPATAAGMVRLELWLPRAMADAVLLRLDRRPGNVPAGPEGGPEEEMTRLDFAMTPGRADAAVRSLAEAFPDAPLFHEIVPLHPVAGRAGLGRVGVLPAPLQAADFGELLSERLRQKDIRWVGRPDRTIRKVALCSGSGGSLLQAFFASGADAYVTGDVRYHDARTVEERDRCLFDIGHFESEHWITESLKDRLEARMAARGWAVPVRVSDMEHSPFRSR